MFVPSSSGPKLPDLDVSDRVGPLIQNPGLPEEVWTEEACGRTWIYTTGSLAVLGTMFAVTTWYLNSLQREGMFGLVVLLAFFSWIGCNGFGVLTGLIGMVVASGKDRLAALSVTLLNVVPLLLAYLLHHK